MSDGGSVDTKEGAIDEGVPGGQTGNTASTKPDGKRSGDILSGRIGLVGSLIEQVLVVDGQRNFVAFPSVVKHAVRVDRDVASVPGVSEPDSSNDGESEESAKEDLKTE